MLCADSLSEGVWLGVPSADVDSPAVALCDDCEAVPDALSSADEEDEPCEVCAVVCVCSERRLNMFAASPEKMLQNSTPAATAATSTMMNGVTRTIIGRLPRCTPTGPSGGLSKASFS